MVQITQVFGNPKAELVTIEVPKDSKIFDTYIVNKLNPVQREQIDTEQKENCGNLFEKTLDRDTVRQSHHVPNNQIDKIFFYIFNGELYKIEGAQKVFILDEKPLSEKKAIFIAFDENYVYFYKFYYNEADSSNYHIHYSSVPRSLLISHNSVTSIFCDDEYYYITPSALVKENKKAYFIKLNFEIFEGFEIERNSIIIEHSCTKFCILTPKGFFISPEFKFYDLRNMIKFLGKNYTDFYYKWFVTPTGRKFVFVSKRPIEFSNFEIPSAKEYKNGVFVEGLLYDVDEQKFIAPSINSIKSKKRWLTFFLYDAGVPHVYKIDSSASNVDSCEFAILYLNARNTLSKFICVDFPTFVTHFTNPYFDDPNSKAMPIRKRIIFANVKKAKKGSAQINDISASSAPTHNNCIFVFDDELNIIFTDNYVCFHAAIFFVDQYHSTRCRFKAMQYSNMISYFYLDDKNSFGKHTSIIHNSKSSIFHLFGNDSIIINSYKGEFGEYVLVFLSPDLKIDYSLSFFEYKKIKISTLPKNTSKRRKIRPQDSRYYLRTVSRRNDFENATHLIELNEKVIFSYNDFISHLANNS